MTIDGNSGGIVVGQGTLDTAASFTTVELAFGADGIAPFKLNYTDAGKVKLFAAAHVSNAEDADTKTWVEGTSNEFVVSPAGLCVKATAAAAACVTEDASCSAFIAAGENFALKVSGRQWGGAGDSNYCDNGITPNFELNDITLTHSVTAPSSGVDGDLGVGTVNISSGGEATISDQTINEVGVFKITAEPPEYFGIDSIPDSTSAAIGRFYPDHFAVGAGGTGVKNRINRSCSEPVFTYMSEEFETKFDLVAQNSTNGVTQNYIGNFAKLTDVAQLDFKLINKPASGAMKDLSARQPNTAVAAEKNAISGPFNWVAGYSSITLNLLLKRLSTEDGPYTDLSLAIAPDDGDAQLNSFDVDISKNGSNDHAVVGEKTEVRYGRMQIQNTYGPETSALNQPVFIQYYDGTGFVTNTDDSCTAISTGNMTLQEDGESALAQGVVTNVPVGSGTTDLTLGANTVAAGEANLTYTPTGAGNTGTLTMTYDVPAWLEFNWSASSNDPSATVTFGRYRGSDRVIYWLEQ